MNRAGEDRIPDVDPETGEELGTIRFDQPEAEPAPAVRASRTVTRRRLLMYLAVALVALAGWQAERIAGGQEGPLTFSKPKGPPVKVRSAGRGPSAHDRAIADPVGTYLAKAKRGMTDREIRWMIEDFQAAGLDVEVPPKSALALYEAVRARQDKWYADAIDEALGLTPAQHREVVRRLGEKRKIDTRHLVQNPGIAGLPDDQSAKLFGDRKYDSLDYAYSFLGIDYQSAFAPWQLCELSPAQSSLTMKDWVEARRLEQATSGAVIPDDNSGEWFSSQPRGVFDPGAGRVVKPAGDVPFSGEGMLVSDLFPPIIDQKAGGGGNLGEARECHPAQLRAAMLFDRKLATNLLAELDTSSSRQIAPVSSQPPVATPPHPSPDSGK